MKLCHARFKHLTTELKEKACRLLVLIHLRISVSLQTLLLTPPSSGHPHTHWCTDMTAWLHHCGYWFHWSTQKNKCWFMSKCLKYSRSWNVVTICMLWNSTESFPFFSIVLPTNTMHVKAVCSIDLWCLGKWMSICMWKCVRVCITNDY